MPERLPAAAKTQLPVRVGTTRRLGDVLLTTVVVGDALAQLGGAAMLAAALVVTRARLVRDGPTTGSLPLILPTRLGDRGAGLLAAGAF